MSEKNNSSPYVEMPVAKTIRPDQDAQYKKIERMIEYHKGEDYISEMPVANQQDKGNKRLRE